MRRIFGFVRVPSSDARLLVGLERSGGSPAHRPRDPAFLSSALLLRPAGAADCMVRRRAADRRSDPVARAHRRAHRTRRPSGARFDARPGPRNSRRSTAALNDMAQQARRSRAANCARPTVTSRNWRRATRCRASPTGAASIRGLPPNGSGPASCTPGRAADDRRRSLQAVQRSLRPRRRRRMPAPDRQAAARRSRPATTTCRRATAARNSRCCCRAPTSTRRSRSANGCAARSRNCASRTRHRRAGRSRSASASRRSFPASAEDAEHLVEAADIALYAAKRRGRNTVVAHGAVVLAEAS